MNIFKQSCPQKTPVFPHIRKTGAEYLAKKNIGSGMPMCAKMNLFLTENSHSPNAFHSFSINFIFHQPRHIG